MNLQQIINSINWRKTKERNIDVAIESLYVIGQDGQYFRDMGVDFDPKNHIGFSNGKLYYDKTELARAKRVLLDKKMELAPYANTLTDNFLQFAREHEAFAQKYTAFDFMSCRQEELADIYDRFLFHVYRLVPYSYIISMSLEDVAREIIIQALTGLVDDPAKAYMMLVVPNKQNKLSQEHIDRLALAQVYKQKTTEEINKLLDKHIDTYRWLFCYRPQDAPLSKAELIEDIESIVQEKDPAEELRAIITAQKQARKNAETLLHSLSLPGHIVALIRVMQKNAWVRTYRREPFNYGFFVFRPFHECVAQLMGLDIVDLKYIACWEIQNFLINGTVVTEEDIAKRKEYFVMGRLLGKEFVVGGGDAQDVQIDDKAQKNHQTISGSIAFKGNVHGSVRIVRRKKDMLDFKDGEILVASTVATWMTPVVKKCAGIVINEGGALSHAMIVAREFQKPCIVGTSVVTDIFENGDIIEVNADEGAVKLVTSN